MSAIHTFSISQQKNQQQQQEQEKMAAPLPIVLGNFAVDESKDELDKYFADNFEVNGDEGDGYHFLPLAFSSQSNNSCTELMEMDGRSSAGMLLPQQSQTFGGRSYADLDTMYTAQSPADSIAGELLYGHGQDLCPETIAAMEAAHSSGAQTPFIKEELRCKIQMRRQMEGKQELQVDWTPKNQKPLSSDAQKKREDRRNRNRLAAQKCRAKKRQTIGSMQKQVDALTLDKMKLEREMEGLRCEYNTLHDILYEHSKCCPNVQVPAVQN